MNSSTVLIVDDNPINLKLARIILLSEGYTVVTAGDAEEALGVLETLRPALILMDLQLPGMDGLTLVQELRKNARWASTWIVALTAYAMKGDEAKALSAGCDGYLTKPIDPDTLPRAVSSFLASARRAEPASGEE